MKPPRRRNDTARLGGSRGSEGGGVPGLSDLDLFVSYAQHGEDVILWRALGGRAEVFYVDVGAFDPTYDSVTRALYERGWRGINIEPQPDRIQAFEDERPEDLNLNLAIGDQDGTIELILPDNPGWASTLDPTLTGADPSTSQVLVVQLRRLDTLLADLAITHVDVLKIDVEGAEPAVVRGLLGGPVRPRVCVVEGVAPGVGRTFGDEAVALLVDDGYVHCLFDGLNHYLTTDPSLQEALSTPANPLDGFATDLVNRLHAERHENLVTIAALAAENTTLRGLSGTPAAGQPLPDDDVAPVPTRATPADARTSGASGSDGGSPSGAGGGRGDGPRVATVDLTPVDLDPTTRLARRRAMFARLLRDTPNALPPSVLELALADRPPSAAVSILYRAILGRDPEPEGLATWTSHSETGMPFFDIARNLARSDEALGQPPQRRARVQADLAAWSSLRAAMELGIAGQQPRMTYREGAVAHEILVNALFEVGLGSEPAPDEASREIARLVAGVGRERMVRAFAKNPEARRRLLGEPSGGIVHRVRRWWTGRHHVDTFRALVAASEDRQIGQILATLAVARPRIQELAADLTDATEEP